jgi:hypothetical protein
MGRFGSETQMEAARERCCDVKRRTDGGRRAAMWCPHTINNVASKFYENGQGRVQIFHTIGKFTTYFGSACKEVHPQIQFVKLDTLD